jgi:glycosyltransferase involved in cell wall biosynthesis
VRRILLISYHFPPIGGAGGQRPAKLVRNLQQLGFESVVVTGPGPANTRWTPRDDELTADVPADTKILRLSGPEPAPAGRAERLRGRDAWSDWWVRGVVEASRSAGHLDLVYAYMAPFESAEAAATVAAERGVPWLGDLVDPWALDEMMVYPTRFHRSLELRRMRRALGRADAIVMSVPEAVTQVRAHIPELAGKPVVAIGNGFDVKDFAAPVEPRADGRFRIVHTGYLHTDLGTRLRSTARLRRLVGGAARGIDILPRSHVFLLEAVDRLLDADPALASTLEVHLAGVMSPLDREVAERSPAVHLHGYLAHSETVKLMRTADLLFLPMHHLPEGTRARIVPGKTYEYLAAGPPILGAVPEGDARDLLAEAGHAHLCRPRDVEGLAAAIAEEVARWRAGVEPPRARADVVGRYEYATLTGRLADLIDGLVGQAPAAADAAVA